MRAGARSIALGWLATVAACASPPERLYTLSGPESTGGGGRLPTRHVVLGPVSIPASVDRPELLVRGSGVRLVALEQERWAEPLREAIPRVLAEGMRSRLQNVGVTSHSVLAPAQPDLRVAVDVT